MILAEGLVIIGLAGIAHGFWERHKNGNVRTKKGDISVICGASSFVLGLIANGFGL